tara:strand:- start:25923 stop:26831 length:909 start_codon:yes stop_codon:yes gene_type:complete
MIRLKINWLIKFVFVCSAIWLILWGVNLILRQVNPLVSSPKLKPYLVIAHRGGAGLWPENTLLAFRNSIKIGADALEFDVHATADGKFVVFHDSTVERTTNGSGRIDEMTWEELCRLDAGYYWTQDNGETYPYRGKGLTVPSLDEVLAEFSEIQMIIELKPTTETIRSEFSRMISQNTTSTEIVIASFNSDNVKYIRTHNPQFATTSTVGEVFLFWILHILGIEFLYSPGGDAMMVPPSVSSLPLATPKFVSRVQAHQIAIYIWTINSEEDLRRYSEVGFDGIITDYPDRLLRILGRPSKTN